MVNKPKDLSLRQDQLHFTVKGPESLRLDRYLGKSFNWKSRTHLQDLIKEGRVLVNGEPSKPSRRVRRGDEIAVRLPSEGSALPAYDKIQLDVLYEDPWLVAVNKPPGLLVHPVGSHVYDTLINILHHRYHDMRDEEGEPVRPRLCHRLDKETTGVVVVGKDTYVHSEVRDQFETRLVSKQYHALVRGDYQDDGSIEIPIGEGHDLESSVHHPSLKASLTEVKVIARLGDYTLLSCTPATGRQNQIRIHLSAVGFPIVGDERFGSNAPPADFPRRYLLHSRCLRFFHPRRKTWVELSAPLPADFCELLERLRGA